MNKLETIQKYILYSVTFPINEYNSDSPRYFTSKENAEKCANLKLGWYGGTGICYAQEFSSNLPKYYESFEEWAKEKLTYNECKKLNII